MLMCITAFYGLLQPVLELLKKKTNTGVSKGRDRYVGVYGEECFGEKG